MIFLTVGTQFPFDRLVRVVDEALGLKSFSEEVFGQIGESSYKPHNFEAVKHLEKKQYDRIFQEAAGIISHAGMGTITMALKQQKPILVLPRRKMYGEVVNDHQLEIARRFASLKHLLMAEEPEELAEKLNILTDFKPNTRETQVQAVQERICQFLQTLP